MSLRAPFPYAGGKSRAAALIWQALGPVRHYIEPFCGSAAVLLARPDEPRVETINDLDCHVANFWRAVQSDAAAVARYCDWPQNEADLHARHAWLVAQLPAHRERILSDPEYFDPKIAAWWCWGACQWIGDGWCASRKPSRQLGNLGSCNGRGMHRKLASLGGHAAGGCGVHRKLAGGGIADESIPFLSLQDWFAAIQQRLRRVRVACGDWTRVLGPSILGLVGGLPTPCGIFLDPPYLDGDLDYAVGGTDTTLAADVAAWARKHGDNPHLRIVLAGYEGNYDLPGWRTVAWKSKGGYSGQNRGSGKNRNQKRERLWLSPCCLGVRQPTLPGVAP